MRFSIVIPSFLGSYSSAAHNRKQKLVRAINSCLNQSFEDFEIHVVADGCQETIDIVQSNIKDSRLHLWKIPRKELWSGGPRNKGIDEAKGEYIIYLDIDDIYGKDHLKMVDEHLGNYDWVWYNDIRYKTHLDYWYDNPCEITQLGRHGTSNICHRIREHWDEKGRYAHDFVFVQKLLKNSNYTKIPTPEYYVCHVPGFYDL